MRGRVRSFDEHRGLGELEDDGGGVYPFHCTRIAGDSSLRAQLASRGIERAREFTWKRCAERAREAYRRASTRYTGETMARAYSGLYARVTKRVAA